MNLTIETKRLQLVPLRLEELVLLCEDLSALERAIQAVYEGEPVVGELLEITRKQCKVIAGDEENFHWDTFWQILRKGEPPTVVGSFCFKGVPDEKGQVEIGYGLGKSHRGKGYMTEAVEGACRWALEQEGVAAVVAETERENHASQRILRRCGFERCLVAPEHFWWIRKKGSAKEC